MTRRDLIQKVILGGVTILVVPTVLESCSKEDTPADNNNGNNKLTIDLTNPSNSALNSKGGYIVNTGVIIANTGTGFLALASACTHAGCTISYNGTTNNFPCACHGSLFSANGNVLNGPATVALKSYTLSRSGDILTINL